MSIEQYVDIYYIGDDRVKVGRFSAQRVGKIIRVDDLNIPFASSEETKDVFASIKQAIENLSLDSSPMLYQGEYAFISLPLSAVWEYNWVHTTDSHLNFPTEQEARQFFEELIEHIHSISVADAINNITLKPNEKLLAEQIKRVFHRYKVVRVEASPNTGYLLPGVVLGVFKKESSEWVSPRKVEVPICSLSIEGTDGVKFSDSSCSMEASTIINSKNFGGCAPECVKWIELPSSRDTEKEDLVVRIDINACL